MSSAVASIERVRERDRADGADLRGGAGIAERYLLDEIRRDNPTVSANRARLYNVRSSTLLRQPTVSRGYYDFGCAACHERRR